MLLAHSEFPSTGNCELQGALDTFHQASSNIKYRHVLPALVKLCSVTGQHKLALACSRSMHSAFRQVLSTLSAEHDPPSKQHGFISSIPSVLLSLAHCGGTDATVAALLQDCLSRSFSRRPAVWAAATHSIRLEAAAQQQPVRDVVHAFFFGAKGGQLREEARVALQSPAGSACLPALQQLTPRAAFSVPCAANAASAFVCSASAAACDKVGGGAPLAAAQQRALLWAASHGTPRSRCMALQACASQYCWSDASVHSRCLTLLDAQCAHQQAGSVPIAAPATAASRVLLRTGMLLLASACATSKHTHTATHHYIQLLHATLSDSSTAGVHFSESCTSALLLAASGQSPQVAADMLQAVQTAIGQIPLTRAPLALDAALLVLSGNLQAAGSTLHQFAASIAATCACSFAAYVPLPVAQRALQEGLQSRNSTLLCASLLQCAVVEAGSPDSGTWALAGDAIPSGFGVLSLPTTSTAFPAKDFVLSFISPDGTPACSQAAGLQHTLRVVLQHIQSNPKLCAGRPDVAQAVQRSLEARSMAYDDLHLINGVLMCSDI